MAVVLAAHSLGAATAAVSNADDSDRGAVDTEEDVDILQDNTEEAQNRSPCLRVGLCESLCEYYTSTKAGGSDNITFSVESQH